MLYLLFFASLFTSPAFAGEVVFSFDGAISPNITKTSLSGESDTLLLTRLRPNLRYEHSPEVAVFIAYEVNGLIADSLGPSFSSLGTTSKLRSADFKRVFHSDDNLLLAQNLDRLYGEFYLGEYFVRVGRQPIGHGNGRIFNPTDIFAPLSPYSTYSEYKAGVDSIRLEGQSGEDLSWEAIVVAHEDGASDRYSLLRVEKRLPEFNISGYAGKTLGEATLAVDIASDLGGVGWYGEGVWRDREGGDSSLRAMTGAHTRFENDINGLVELFFNGVGEGDSDNYLKALFTKEWQNQEGYLLARWYAAVEADYQFTPLLIGRVVWLQNLSDGSALIQPSFGLSYYEAEELTVSFSGGGSLKIEGRGDNSEFGGYPHTIFFEARVNL